MNIRFNILSMVCSVLIWIAQTMFAFGRRIVTLEIMTARMAVATEPFHTPYDFLSIKPANAAAIITKPTSVLALGTATQRATRANRHRSQVAQINAGKRVDAPIGGDGFALKPLASAGQLATRAGESSERKLVGFNDFTPFKRGTFSNRVSMETPNILSYGLEGFGAFTKNNYWRNTDILTKFETGNLSAIDIDDLAEMLAEMSPEISAALWYRLLSCNSGFTVKALSMKTKEIDQRAQKVLDEFLVKLGKYNGTINVFFDKTFMCILLRGSFMYELVLDEYGREMIDMASPDTKTLSYMRRNDDQRGQVWDFGQWQAGEFVSFSEIETIRYVPLQPLPGKIEGRSPITSSFFIAIFLMSVLRDLKRVIQQQGYMRMDIGIEIEKLKGSMPDDAANDPAKLKAWADGLVASVIAYYSSLKPDDAFVHTDAVTLNKPAGTASSDALRAMDALFAVLERMAARALKIMPLFMGIREGANSATSNREFEFDQQGSATLQRMVESAFSDLCEKGLQAQGVVCQVETKFAEMRASEELRDEQLLYLKAQRARFLYDSGVFSADEMALLAAQKEKADAPAPRAPVSGGAMTGPGGIGGIQPDPSSNRQFSFAELSALMRAPSITELDKTLDNWKKNAPDKAADLLDAKPFVPDNAE